MKRWFAVTLSAAVLFTASSALAGAFIDTKFALHVKSTTKSQKTICNSWSPVPPDSTWGTNPPTPCSAFVTAADVTTNYYIYLVVVELTDDAQPGNGIAGLSCGVQYGTGLLVGWTRCSDLEFPSGAWPATGGGNRITWAPQTNCQDSVVPPYGVQTVAGWFSAYAYGPDHFRLTPNNNVPLPEVVVADCNAAETFLNNEAVGVVVFSAGATIQGCNPCLTSDGLCHTPARPTTWGRIKTKYGE
jgi:hypothetical protein